MMCLGSTTAARQCRRHDEALNAKTGFILWIDAARSLTNPTNTKIPSALLLSEGIFACCVNCACSLRSLTSM